MANTPESGSSYRELRDVAFLGRDRDERLDLYIPAIADGMRTPGIVIIHGGGCFTGDKSDKREKNIASTLTAAGYACASINYMLAPSGEKRWKVFPQNLMDCKSAVRFLRTNAARYSIDPDRIGVIGGSAGGYFALFLGFTGEMESFEPNDKHGQVSSSVQAVVNLYGPCDYTGGAEMSPQLFAGLAERSDEEKRRGSPITFANKSAPPILSIHGNQDPLVPLDQSVLLDRLSKEIGFSHQLVVVENGRHSFDLENSGTDLRSIVTDFFDLHLRAT